MKYSKKVLLLFIVSLLLTSCNSSTNYDNLTEIIKDEVGQYLNTESDKPIVYKEYDANFFVSIHVTDYFSELNRRKQWENIENLAVELGVDSTLNGSSNEKEIYVYFYNSNDSWNMNVFGERKLEGHDYELWMTQYFDKSKNPVFYPSYYDENAVK